MHGVELYSLEGDVGREWAGEFEVIGLVMGRRGRRVSRSQGCEVSDNQLRRFGGA